MSIKSLQGCRKCQLASKLFHSFSKYCVENFGNGRVNGQVENMCLSLAGQRHKLQHVSPTQLITVTASHASATNCTFVVELKTVQGHFCSRKFPVHKHNLRVYLGNHAR